LAQALSIGSLLLLAGIACGCASPGVYTWYRDAPPSDWAPSNGDYLIGAGDTIEIRVFDQDNISTHGKVRSDGKVAMPFVGEVVAGGKTPLALGRELEQRLKEFIVSPRVTVNVVETVPITVSVLGEVGSRGALQVPANATLAQVVAQSGGLSDFADEDSIYVLRQTPQFHRIRFTYHALLRNEGGAATFPLRSGDVVVVE
jgi:polysaccharide export outer membrane protein